jgi:hypothetical protein
MELGDIHVAILAITAIAIVYADHLGYQYVIGTRTLLPRALTTQLHRGVWIGLLSMVVTGVLLAYPMWEYLRSDVSFYVKMGFVLTLVFNSWVIGKISSVASERSFTELTPEERHILMVSGALSFSGWVGSAAIGFFFL